MSPRSASSKGTATLDEPVLPEVVARWRPVGLHEEAGGIEPEPAGRGAVDRERSVHVTSDRKACVSVCDAVHDDRLVERHGRAVADLDRASPPRRRRQALVGEGATDAVAEERSCGSHLGYVNGVAVAIDTIVQRTRGVITEAVLDDVVVLDPASGRYVRLNPHLGRAVGGTRSGRSLRRRARADARGAAPCTLTSGQG